MQNVHVNCEPEHFENAACEGKIVVMVAPPHEGPWLYKKYFAGKSRRVEVQLQIRFKQPPPGCPWLWLSPQPLEKVSLNAFTGVFCKLVLALIRRHQGDAFSWSFGGNGDTPETTPHIALPLSQVLGVWATPPGEAPPRLGSADMTKLQKTGKESKAAWASLLPLDTAHTYTLQSYSMYVDFCRWQAANLPGMSPVSLDRFWPTAEQLRMALYCPTPGGSEVLFDMRIRRGRKALPQVQLAHRLPGLPRRAACRADPDEAEAAASAAGSFRRETSCCSELSTSTCRTDPEEEGSSDECNSAASDSGSSSASSVGRRLRKTAIQAGCLGGFTQWCNEPDEMLSKVPITVRPRRNRARPEPEQEPATAASLTPRAKAGDAPSAGTTFPAIGLATFCALLVLAMWWAWKW